MAQERRRREIPPEEKVVARLLPHVFAGAKVIHHDDGSEDGMYDLQLGGPVQGAVEVGQVTDEAIRSASAHWAKHLQSYRTTKLRRQWLFGFVEDSPPGEATRYPRLNPPSVTDLTAALVRLESRGIEQVGRRWDYVALEPEGFRIPDHDIAALFELLGSAADDATSVDLSHHGEPGGWQFSFGYGQRSTDDPNQFAAGLEALLSEDSRQDLRDKLDRSGMATRVAALVLDSTTPSGWATGHLTDGIVPSGSIRLPSEITHVLVVGMNRLVLLYSEEDGWSRLDPPGFA